MGYLVFFAGLLSSIPRDLEHNTLRPIKNFTCCVLCIVYKDKKLNKVTYKHFAMGRIISDQQVFRQSLISLS